MTIDITTTPVDVTIPSGGTLRGREWIVYPLMPWSGDVSALANTYRSRNAGKSRTVQVWTGVRYAEPPIGARRWKPALDYDYPAGVHEVATWGNVPIQTGATENDDQGRPETGSTVGAQNWHGLGTQESEDCLTLNIWKPVGTPPAGGWPVLVWVHGGGWTQNSALQPHWRGHRLATKGIIVVTVEYRLSIFGHFFHPDWASEPDWQGPTMAITDVKSALRWVNRNIGSFGGNNAKVALAGSSAGGECTLTLQEDVSTASLFRCSWAVSGGGIEDRDPRDPNETFEGYGAFYNRIVEGINAIAPDVRDYSDPTRTLAQAIAADGMSVALRNSVPPNLLLAFLNRRETITRANFVNETYARSVTPDTNRYPWFGGGMIYKRSIDAAKAGAYTRPLIVSSAQNEGNVARGAVTGLIRRLGVFDEAEWMRQSYTDVAWTADQRLEIAYSHSTFQYPAWRIARAMNQTGSASRWLVLWNFRGTTTATAAGHSSDLPFIFGNVEWGSPFTGGVDGECRVAARGLYMAECMMQMMANYVGNMHPNTMYTNATDFDLFASAPYFSLTQYSVSNPDRWNVIGKNGLDPIDAPVECRYEDYFAGAWTDYLARVG